MSYAPSMLHVEEASIEQERPLLVNALHRFLTPHLTSEENEALFAWRYGDAPHGAPRVWTLRSQGRDLIGVATAFPRRVRIGGDVEEGWVLGDFCIHPEHRSLGPALRLQRVFLEEARRGRLLFWYDFPNPGMVAVYRRLGLEPDRVSVRLARPLRIDGKVRAVVRSRRLASLLSAPLHWMLDAGAASKDVGLEFAIHSDPCGPEFTELSSRVLGGIGLATDRSAEYLNWRYHRHPIQAHEFLTARRGGVLAGYAVIATSRSGTRIVDLVGENESPILSALVDALLRLLRGAGVATVSCPILANHPWVPLLVRHGFRPRESVPVLVGGFERSLARAHLDQGGPWHLMDGDRDL